MILVNVAEEAVTKDLLLFPLGPYSVIISFSSSYYNDYNAGGRVLPLDHY